jgi:Copper transport outer membrane protein, MctB
VIDFRYHLVSIVAVFLALAIGIVLGTTALNGPVTKALQKSLTSLGSDNNNLRSQNSALGQELSGANSFAQGAAPQLLRHLLDGQRVVIIGAPGASSEMEHGVMTALQQAGATISGQVQLQDKFFDTSATTLSYMDQLSQDVKPAGLTLADGTPQQRAAQVLARAVATNTAPGLADPAGQAILAGFAGGGFLSASGTPTQRATLAVVITPANPLTGPDAGTANQALTAVATAVSTGSLATVMAGPASSTEAGGAIAALRGSAAASKVSSVDNADSMFGQIVVAQALAEQVATQKPGSYGIGPGNNGVGPSPMPTPTATSSTPGTASPSPTSRAKTRGR